MAETKNVGAIAVEILARTEKLESGMKSAAKTISGFGGMIAGATAAVTSFGLNLATSTASAMAGMVKNSFDTIGAAQDLAISLNAGTTALRGLQYAAKQSGADAGTLNGALQKMNANIGAGLQGEKSAVEAFSQLGLNVRQLATMGADEAFKKIADQIMKLPTPAQQARAAMDLFGRSGQALLPMLNEGSKGIDEMQQRYRDLSGNMTELDVSKVQLAGDLMDDLWELVKGVADQIAVELSPYISYAAKQIIAFGTDGQGAAKMVTQGFDFIVDTIGFVGDSIHFVKAAWQGLVFVFNKGIQLWAEGWAVIAQGIDAAIAKIIEFKKPLQAILFVTPGGGAMSAALDLLPDQMTTKTADFFNDFAKQSGKAAEEAFGNMATEYDKFQKGVSGKGVREWVKNIQTEIEAEAKTLEAKARDKRNRGGSADIPTQQMKASTFNVGSALRLDNSMVSAAAMRAGARKEAVEEIKKSNEILGRIEKKVGGGGAAIPVMG